MLVRFPNVYNLSTCVLKKIHYKTNLHMDCVVVFPNVDAGSLICVGRFVSNVTFELCLQNCLYILTLSFVFLV